VKRSNPPTLVTGILWTSACDGAYECLGVLQLNGDCRTNPVSVQSRMRGGSLSSFRLDHCSYTTRYLTDLNFLYGK